MPKMTRTKETNFKCPKCSSACVYELKTDLFVCKRPIVSSTGEVSGSCGKFYASGNRK